MRSPISAATSPRSKGWKLQALQCLVAGLAGVWIVGTMYSASKLSRPSFSLIKNHPRNHRRDTATNPQSSKKKEYKYREGDTFLPGSLPWSRPQVLQKCIPNGLSRYGHDEITNMTSCTHSKERGVVFVQVAKTGTSTTRRYLSKVTRDAKKDRCMSMGKWQWSANRSDYLVFATSRDPMGRFLSGFQEVTLNSFTKSDPDLPHPQRYPKTYKALKSMQGVRDKMLSKGIQNEEGPYPQFYNESWSFLKQTLSDYIDEYDGQVPIDSHVRLQVALMQSIPDWMAPIDLLLDTENLSRQLELVIPPTVKDEATGSKHRAKPKWQRRVPLLPITDVQQQRKVCHLLALDYCCLNYPLPAVCEDTVQCQWVRPSSSAEELRIEPIAETYYDRK